MYEVSYTTTGFDKCYKRGFKTFADAKAWAVENCREVWWTISRYWD